MNVAGCFHSNSHGLILTVSSVILYASKLCIYFLQVWGKGNWGLLKDWLQELQENRWTQFVFHWSMPLWCQPRAGLLTNHHYNSFCHVFTFYPSANIDNLPIVTFIQVLTVQYLLTAFSCSRKSIVIGICYFCQQGGGGGSETSGKHKVKIQLLNILQM